MSRLFTVYAHETRGAWGFTALRNDGKVLTASIDREGRVTQAILDPLKVGPEMQRRLRTGFRKLAQPRYLLATPREGVLHGEFVVQHPDFGEELGGELLFFVAVPQGADMQQVSQDWEEQLDGSSGNSAGRQAWLQRCAQATAYVPVKSEDAHAALLVADWARRENLVLVAQEGQAPLGGVAQQRYEWRRYLSTWIKQEEVDRALTELGWPLSEVMEVAAAAATPETKTPAGDAEWLALAQQASF